MLDGFLIIFFFILAYAALKRKRLQDRQTKLLDRLERYLDKVYPEESEEDDYGDDEEEEVEEKEDLGDEKKKIIDELLDRENNGEVKRILTHLSEFIRL